MSVRSRPIPTGVNLVYFEDRGAVYDAPPDVVWDFMTKDQTFHPRAHKGSVRKFRSRKLSDVSELLSWEEREGRSWRARSARMTEIRPAVRIQEDLDGRYAGSTLVFLYAPLGRKTRVDVLCYMRSTEQTPRQIEAWWRRNFADNFREDRPWLRRYAKSVTRSS